MYTFFGPVLGDLLGFSSPNKTNPFVALYDDFTRTERVNVVPVFHELAHFLIDIRARNKKTGLLKIVLKEKDGRKVINLYSRKNFDEKFTKFAEVMLDGSICALIDSEKWGDWTKDPHYLLRALQMQIFLWNDLDRKISRRIREIWTTTVLAEIREKLKKTFPRKLMKLYSGVADVSMEHKFVVPKKEER